MPTDTPSPEPSPEMMERARLTALIYHVDHGEACRTGPSCACGLDSMVEWLALAFSEVAREARDAERERAAKLVEDHGHSNGNIRAVHKHLAKAIRSEPTE